MPVDVKIGKALADYLNANTELKVRFTFDPYVTLDDPDDSTQVMITTERFPSTRQSRQNVTYDAFLRLFFLVEAKANLTDDAVFEQWLDRFDELLKTVWETRIFGKVPSDIDTPERFDRAKLQDISRLVIYCDIQYSLV